MRALLLSLLIGLPAYGTEQEEFDKIMNTLPMHATNVCNEYVNDFNKFKECLAPYVAVLDCRFRVKTLVLTKENEAKFTKDELTHMFLERYHLCMSGGNIYDDQEK